MMRLIRKLFGGFDPSLKELTDEQMGRIWGAGGSGGQSGETVYKWNDDMARQWAGDDNLLGLLPRANEVSTRGFTPYGGERVAGLSMDQQGAGDSIRHLATAGSTIGNAGRDTAFRTAQGGFLGQRDSQGNWQSANPYDALRIEPGQNKYSGMSEDYRALKGQAMGDLRDQYEQGTAADTQRMFAQSGAFGGSAHQQAVKNNADMLGKNLSRLGQEMDNEQYNRSAQLEEANIWRGMQAQMSDINRLNQGYQFERGNQQNAAQMSMNAEQGIADLYRQRMGVGDLYRDDAQRRLDVGYGDWTQGQDWDRNNVNWLASLLGTAQGSTGVTQQFGGYGNVNPVAGLLGAAALGRGMDFF